MREILVANLRGCALCRGCGDVLREIPGIPLLVLHFGNTLSAQAATPPAKPSHPASPNPSPVSESRCKVGSDGQIDIAMLWQVGTFRQATLAPIEPGASQLARRASRTQRPEPASQPLGARQAFPAFLQSRLLHRPSQWHPDRSRSIPRPRNCDPAHGSPPLRSLPSWRAPRPRLASPRCAMSDIVRNIEPVSRLAFQQLQRLPPSRIWTPLAALPTTLPAAVWQEHLRSPAACEPHNTLT